MKRLHFYNNFNDFNFLFYVIRHDHLLLENIIGKYHKTEVPNVLKSYPPTMNLSIVYRLSL